MIIGAHVSIAGGYETALKQTQKIDGNALQIFAASPRSWQPPKNVDLTEFNQQVQKQGIKKIFVHAKYLINLASDNPETRKKSVQSLIEDLEFTDKIGAEGVIFHPHLGQNETLKENIEKVLSQAPKSTRLILENSAQTKLEDLISFYQNTNQARIKLCLDTAHLFESGLNLASPTDQKKLVAQIEKVGWNKLALFHLNDSRTKLGSNHDIHANIGEGELGIGPFQFIVNHPQAKNIPYILETPAGKDNLAEQKENLDRVKSCLSRT